MKITPRKATAYERYRSEWNNSENDTFDVVDSEGRILKNFETRVCAERFIEDNSPITSYDRFHG